MKLLPWRQGAKAARVDAAASFMLGGNMFPQWPEDNYEQYAREGYGRNELVFACINEIATSAADARLTVERQGRQGTAEPVSGTPLAMLLDAPNPEMEQFEFLEGIHTYLQLAGNCYVFKLRARARQVQALYLLRPDRVRIEPGPAGVAAYIYAVDGYEYRIAADDVGHIKLPNPFSDWYGLSPLHVLARQVNLDSSMTDFVKVFFQNAGVPSGLLNLKRKLSSQDEANRIRAHWKSQFQGVTNWHRIAILDEDASYQAMAVEPDKMTMPDLRGLTETRICMAYGVPPILVGAKAGLDRSTFANYGEARRSFWDETLLPEYKRLRAALTRILRPDFPELAAGTALAWDFSEVKALQDDEDKKSTRLLAQFAGGLITRDEAREALGYDPAPERGAVFRIPINVEEVGPDAPAPEPQPAALGPAPTMPDQPMMPPGKAALGAETKQLKQHPGTDRLLVAIEAARRPVEQRAERELTGYYRRLAQRVDGVLGRQMSAAAPQHKDADLPVDPDALVPAEADAELQRLMREVYLLAIEGTWEAVNASGLAGLEPFDAGMPPVQRLLGEGATRVIGLNDTTRAALREALQTGISRGYSIQQIAAGVPGDEYPGVRSIIQELYRSRARTIARTETMFAQLGAQLARYAAAGLTHVEAQDGSDDPVCAARNGQRFTLAEAAAIRDHPNGTLNWLPVLPALE